VILLAKLLRSFSCSVVIQETEQASVLFFGSLKPLLEMNFESTSCNVAVKPPHENLPLSFREEEFSSAFVSDDGL